jgi:photosystem II stability/assembly factor-like uncharacterized protein
MRDLRAARILGRVTARLKGAACAALLAALAPGAGCGRRPERAASVPAVSKDAGGWTEVPLGTDAVFNGLHFVDAATGWIVGGSPFVSGGIVGRTEDGGKSWRYVSGVTGGGPTFVLSAVHGFDRMRACAVGEGIFLTFDGGQSWQMASVVRRHAAHLNALFFLDANEGWAAGPAGVLHTTDAGLNWREVDGDNSGARHVNARVLLFTHAGDGWIAGQNGTLLRTRDGGETWSAVSFPPPATGDARPYLFGGTWTDASHGWFVGDHGTVLRTGDGGDTWTLVDAGTRDAFLTGIAFAGADGWIAGFLPDGAARSVVYRTKDGGTTWALERTVEGEELRALQVLDADTAWAVGDKVRTEPQRMLRRSPPIGR